MKRIILLCAAVIMTAAALNAQPRAVGGRIGAGITASYQHSVSNSNMVSVDLDFPMFYGGIQAAATYDWIFPINSWNERGAWNWYAGVGAGLGFGWPHISKDTYGGATYRTNAGSFNIGAVGRIGVEYQFWFPLQLSIDWRPMFGPDIFWNNTATTTGGTTVQDKSSGIVFNTSGLYASAICLGVRYRF